jgi:hypothetical protein
VSTVSVYWISGGFVAAAHRSVAVPAVARAAVDALLAGPTAAEADVGYGTRLPKGLKVTSLTIVNRTARVALAGAGSVPAPAVAQLVCTLTQFAGVDDVAATVDGSPLTVVNGRATMTRADVEQWLPAILIESPVVGESVGSPLRVHGSANTFEAVLRLQVTDWDGRIVADVTTMATSGTGTRGTFDVTIPYTVDRVGAGEIIASYNSAKDGSRVVVAEVPLWVGP